METAANAYQELRRTTEKERESNQRGSITSVYEYDSVTLVDTEDALQQFVYVKVEATSFTVSEPTEPLEISPLLYSEATETQRDILEKQFEVRPFMIQTIKMERIFADKILAAEFYYQRGMLFDTAKHLYDLATMLDQERIQRLLTDPEELIRMLAYKRKEEKERIGSDLAQKPFSEFTLFQTGRDDLELRDAFMRMQQIYVFSDEDILQPESLQRYMDRLTRRLLSLDENLEHTRQVMQPSY